MSVLEINKNNFDFFAASDKTVLIDFYADWCGPCRMLSPIVNEIAEQYPQYVVGKVNVDHETELAGKFGVSGIPTLVVLKKGRTAAQSTGVRTKAQILAMLDDDIV